VDAAVLAALGDLLPDMDAWLRQVSERQTAERDRLRAEYDRARRERDEASRTLAKAEARWVKLDAVDQELTLGALRRAGTELEHAETRLAATEGALEAVPTEAPTDALLDFSNALQRALRGVDRSSSLAQVNAELAAIFEGFYIHPPGHGHGLIIGPLLHGDVAHAILFEGKPHPDRITQPILAGSEPPPMKWLTDAYRKSDYSQEPWHFDL
jgi:hypothetical protein